RFFFFSSRRRHTRFSRDWSSDVCSSDLPVIVENKPGALTSIGNRALSEATPDGYTFGWLTLSAVVLPITMKEYQIDPVKGFTPRSEERRVGKECRFRWLLYHQKKQSRNI